jgi:hypothetical protein
MNLKKSLLALLLTVPAFSLSWGEVAVTRSLSSRPALFVAQANPNDPDPDPFLPCWTVLMDFEPGYVLNPGGTQAGDGPPYFGFAPQMAVPPPPSISWAKQVSSGNHDPVYAQFVNGAWTTPVVVSSDPGDDLDPQMWMDSGGTIHVAWWRAAADGSGGEVLYASRPAGSGTFSPEEVVSLPGEKARNATMRLLPSGEVLVGYETDPINGQKTVVVASKANPMAVFQPVVVTSTPVVEAAAPEVKAASGHRWTTWVDTGNRVGYSELLNGQWTTPSFEPIMGPGGAAQARMAVQSRILNP